MPYRRQRIPEDPEWTVFRYINVYALPILRVAKIPLLAYLIFMQFEDRVEKLLEKRKYPDDSDTHGKTETDEELGRKIIFGQHTEYVTDHLTSYTGHAAPCLPEHYAVFLVCAAITNVKNRAHMREIYGNPVNTKPYRIKLVFLVGRPDRLLDVAILEREDAFEKDLVLGQFRDSYDNLTYKTVMGYRWAHDNCKHVKLILKIDDDVFLDTHKFFPYFQPIIAERQRTVHCYLNFDPSVFRRGKYQVTTEEYPGSTYPNFCSGFFVVATPDVLVDFFDKAQSVRFLRLEDVFSYGLVRHAQVDVQAIHLDTVTHEWYLWEHCVNTFGYACKYMAVEVDHPDNLLTCKAEATNLRKRWNAHLLGVGLHLSRS